MNIKAVLTGLATYGVVGTIVYLIGLSTHTPRMFSAIMAVAVASFSAVSIFVFVNPVVEHHD